MEIALGTLHLTNNLISPYSSKITSKTRKISSNSHNFSNIWTSTFTTISRSISKTSSILITSSRLTSCSRAKTSKATLATTFCQRWLIINRSKYIINHKALAILTFLSITIERTALHTTTRSPNHTTLAATSSIQIKTISLTQIKINESFFNQNISDMRGFGVLG